MTPALIAAAFERALAVLEQRPSLDAIDAALREHDAALRGVVAQEIAADSVRT